ncbi:MAG TPA: TraR/DksA C4-type zinc finger protein [Polyangia bacterium]|nr:TraR/DksA C4-type zinc finger protein [Polyangia bacterium]
MAIGVVDPVTTSGPVADQERRVLAALDRVNLGTFGLCIDCENPIERSRIEREPLVERCSFCASSPGGRA